MFQEHCVEKIQCRNKPEQSSVTHNSIPTDVRGLPYQQIPSATTIPRCYRRKKFRLEIAPYIIRS